MFNPPEDEILEQIPKEHIRDFLDIYSLFDRTRTSQKQNNLRHAQMVNLEIVMIQKLWISEHQNKLEMIITTFFDILD